MAKAMGTKKTTPKQETATVVQEPVISEASQKAIEDYKANQADESAKLATDAGKANDQALTYAENADDNEMLTRAAQFGEKIGDDPDFVQDTKDIEHAAEVNDSKIMTMLKHLERRLTNNELLFLPKPMSTRADALNKRKSDNEPLLYDKPKASAGRSKVETFYSQLVKHTPLGKATANKLEALAEEKKQAEAKPENARDLRLIEAEEQAHNRTLRNLLNAIRAAADVRVVLNDLREHKNIVVEWIREPMAEGAVLPDNYDPTSLNCPGAGEVVKVSKCLLIYNKAGYASQTAAAQKARAYSLGTVRRWNVANAQLWRAKSQTPRSYINMDDLISSPKPPTKPGQAGSGMPASTAGQITIAKAKRYEASTISEAESAANGLVDWYQGETPSEQHTNHKTLLNLIEHSHEGNGTFYKLNCILNSIYDNKPTLRDEAKAWLIAQSKK